MKRVYLDTETSGFQPGQIAQISYLVEDNNEIVKRVNQYLTVEYMSDDAAKTTGLTKERLKELSRGRVFKERAKEFFEDLDGSILVAQNVGFDEKFVSAELYRCGISYIPEFKFCTMKYFTNIMQLPRKGGGYKYPSLQEIMAYLDIKTSDVERFAQGVYGKFPLQAHDARFDAMGVYLICKKSEKAGMLNIEESIRSIKI